jgi:hypothetical protein
VLGRILASLLLLLPGSALAQRAGVELALRRVANVDETLSPLRYRGNALALRGLVRLPGARVRLFLGADIAAATLSADVGASQRPEVDAMSAGAEIVSELRERTVGPFSLVPTVALAGRLAGREHRFTAAQSGGRFTGVEQSSHDEIVALRPGLRIGRGAPSRQAITLSLAASVVGAARHPYYPGGVDAPAPWVIGGPGSVLLADWSVDWGRPASRHGSLGARYSGRLARIAGTSALGESSHQLGLTYAWGAR